MSLKECERAPIMLWRPGEPLPPPWVELTEDAVVQEGDLIFDSNGFRLVSAVTVGSVVEPFAGGRKVVRARLEVAADSVPSGWKRLLGREQIWPGDMISLRMTSSSKWYWFSRSPGYFGQDEFILQDSPLRIRYVGLTDVKVEDEMARQRRFFFSARWHGGLR